MKENVAKALVVFVPGFLIFWFLRPRPENAGEKKSFFDVGSKPDKNKNMRTKIVDCTVHARKTGIEEGSYEDNAVIVLRAYIDAWNKGEPQSRLDELNDITMQQFGMKVKQNDLILTVVDENNEEIITNG